MKIVHVVNGFAIVMLMVALTSVSVAIWSARQSDFHNHRISLAHTSYEHHLELTADTYLMFKRFGDFLLAGDADQIQDVDLLIARLRGHVTNIRDIIEREIALVGEEEREELELLGEIEAKIEELIAQFQRALKSDEFEDPRFNWRELSLVLNDDIKSDFRELIAVALQEEEDEVAETEAEARYQMAVVRAVSYALGAIFLMITIFALAIFRREFTLPLKRLLTGVRGFADGDFSSLIKLRGRTELSEIGAVLDEMAEVVSNRTKTLTSQNEELERAVQERTEKLEKLLADARMSEENRRQLLTDVSHELRTPLTVIQGESDIALRGKDKTAEEYKEALSRSRTAANHTANLVNDLLFIARNEAGSLRLSREKVDLVDLITEVVAISGTEARFETLPEKCEGFVDQQRLRQAILALLHNAKHHGGAEIDVRLIDNEDSYDIAVSDNGPGLDEAEKERAFERFFRGSNAANRYTEGLGLGLPIVRSIAEAHGGNARITDNQPVGTTVWLTLPKLPAG